jgi:hypothetical protein
MANFEKYISGRNLNYGCSTYILQYVYSILCTTRFLLDDVVYSIVNIALFLL